MTDHTVGFFFVVLKPEPEPRASTEALFGWRAQETFYTNQNDMKWSDETLAARHESELFFLLARFAEQEAQSPAQNDLQPECARSVFLAADRATLDGPGQALRVLHARSARTETFVLVLRCI